MKKIIFTLVFFLAFITGYTQIPVTLLDTNKIWSVLNIAYQENGTGSVFYRFSEDTIIKDLKYFKVYQSYDSTKLLWNYAQILVREDSGKVYKRDYRDSDILIYNFNLHLKDTITLEALFEQQYKWVVDSIDSVIIQNIKYKRMLLQSPYCSGCLIDTWIEGIGSLLGVMNSGNMTIDFSTELLCVEDKDGYMYKNPNYQSCYYSYVGIKTTKIQDEIKIYPIPVKNSFTIATELNFYDVTIYNAIGGLVHRKTYSGNSVVDFSAFDSGLYLIKVKSGNITKSKKILKIK
jgi:hypothetical protein